MGANGHGLLTIDCGNSTISCLRHADGVRLVVPTHDISPLALAEIVDGVRITRCVAVSVVDAALDAVDGLLRGVGIVTERAGREHPCPLRLAYATPATLGADRWVGALAAHRRFGTAITVDCGTATTINLVDRSGTFHGGAIAPGLAAIVTGMQARTPALPPAALDASPTLPARDTQSGVDAGVLVGYAGMVGRLIEQLAASPAGTTAGPATIVVTGGNAARLLRHAGFDALHVPDLVHDGLALLPQRARCDC